MTDTIETLSLGQQLKSAREALNLSITDVAQKTNLKKAHLEALEDDIFILPNVPPTFVRGYVRNYVRFLRLPETLVGSVNYGEVTIPKEVKRTVTAPIPVKNNQKSQTRWVKGLTWLILLGAIGMTLAWWWQEHKKEQASSEQMVSNAVEISPSNSQSTQGASAPIMLASKSSDSVSDKAELQKEEVQKAEPQRSVETNAETATTVTNSVEATQAVNSASQSVQQPVALENSVTENTQTAVAQTEQANAVAQVNQAETVTNATQTSGTAENSATVEPVNVLQQTAEPQTAQEQATQEQVVSNDELRIEVTNAASWITVRGVKNKKLAEKLYNAGDVLTFNSNEQYRLTIGAPANVKIYYKGQPVPLKVDGRVARFKLPLAK